MSGKIELFEHVSGVCRHLPINSSIHFFLSFTSFSLFPISICGLLIGQMGEIGLSRLYSIFQKKIGTRVKETILIVKTIIYYEYHNSNCKSSVVPTVKKRYLQTLTIKTTLIFFGRYSGISGRNS